MPRLPVVAIIGAGRLGIALANLLALNHYPVLLGTRDPAATSKRLRDISTAQLQLVTVQKAARQGDINLLTVSDNVIASVCNELSEQFDTNSVVAHCSGALDSSVLDSAKMRNLPVCSIHPLNTFPSIEAGLQVFSDKNHGTYLYGEGEQAALTRVNTVFESVGFHTACISSAAKPLYHAACVFACNYLTVLMELSLATAEAAPLDRQTYWRALQPLISSTINNIEEGDTSNALSGPIARGDEDTVSKHANHLQQVSASIAHSYLDLGRHALSLAIQKDQLSSAQISALRRVLKE